MSDTEPAPTATSTVSWITTKLFRTATSITRTCATDIFQHYGWNNVSWQISYDWERGRQLESMETNVEQLHGHCSTQDATDININIRELNQTFEGYTFNSRNQQDNESTDVYRLYVTAVCTLSRTCNFCGYMHDSIIHDRIVLRVQDHRTRKRLLQEWSLTLLKSS